VPCRLSPTDYGYLIEYPLPTSSYPTPTGYPGKRSECFGFYEVWSSSKPEVYGSPIKLGMTRVNGWGDDVGKFVGDGTTPHHTRPRPGIQVSAANAFGFYDARGNVKLECLWIPNQVGDDWVELLGGRHHTPSYPTPIGYPGERSECFCFYEVWSSSKPEGYGSPIKLGMTRVDSWG
jgi:hypothetical protein